MNPTAFLDQCPIGRFDAAIFRAIYTCFPSKNLYSDIGFREGDSDYEIVMDLANSDASIDFSSPQQLRPFQYGDLENFLKNYVSEVIPRDELLFPLKNAQFGRFSDGGHGVFYAAAEEPTSLAEVAYHFVEECRYDARMSPDIFLDREIDKRIVRLDIKESEVPDFRSFQESVSGLTSESFEFCQALGKLAVDRDLSMFLTPSCRSPGGTCTPIFSEKAVLKDQVKTIRYYHLKFDMKNGLRIKKSDIQQTDLPIPSEWNFL